MGACSAGQPDTMSFRQRPFRQRQPGEQEHEVSGTFSGRTISVCHGCQQPDSVSYLKPSQSDRSRYPQMNPVLCQVHTSEGIRAAGGTTMRSFRILGATALGLFVMTD